MAAEIIRFLCIIFILHQLPGSDAATFTLTNNCNDTVRTSILAKPQHSPTAFALKPGESRPFLAPNTSWSARIWGRTVCTQHSARQFFCHSGDHCGSSTAVECNSRSVATNGSTLVEVTLDANGELDSYSIHLVHGYNLLPIAVVPQSDGIGVHGPDCSSSFHPSCVSAKYLVTFCPDSFHVDKKSRYSKKGSEKKALLWKLAELLKLIGIAMWVLATIWTIWKAGCSLKERCIHGHSDQLAEAASAAVTTIAQQLSDGGGDDNA